MSPSPNESSGIRIEGLRKIYRTADSQEIEALSEINHTISEREFVAILGPSGCGKTTLLKIIGDIIPATGGRVLIGDRSAAEARRNRTFGFFFQDDVMLPWLSVLRNVTLPYELSGEYWRDRSGVLRKAEAILERVGLRDFENVLPRELSGGMRQRVALARGLIFDPNILLMDEPFASLDELTRTEMNQELLRIIEASGKTVVFVTHHIPEAVFLSDRILVMSHRPGRILEDVAIDLPRPRTLGVRHTQQFQDYAKALERHFHPD